MKFEVNDLRTLRAALDRFCQFLKDEDVCEESIFDSRLVLSELAGNVLRHTESTARIRCGIVDGKVQVEVSSATAFCPPEKPCLPAAEAESGRGLYLVKEIGELCSATAEGGIRVVIRTRYAETGADKNPPDASGTK